MSGAEGGSPSKVEEDKLPARGACWTLLTYAAWLPPFGLCGSYLCLTGRRRHAFLHASTCGFAGLGWLVDFFRLGLYLREEAGLEAIRDRVKRRVKLYRTGLAFALAFFYCSLLEAAWSFEYDNPAVLGRLPAEYDARSWSDPYLKAAALIAHTVVATVGAVLAHTLGPDLTVSWMTTAAVSALALAAAAGAEKDAGENSISALNAYSLPYVAAGGAAMGALFTLRIKKAAPGATSKMIPRPKRGGCCGVALLVLLWWTALLCGLALHAEAQVEPVAMKPPRECSGLKFPALMRGIDVEAWELPDWHVEAYRARWGAKCTSHKEAQEAAQGSSEDRRAGPTPGIKLGPLLWANGGRLRNVARAAWTELTARVRASGGWRSFAGETYREVVNRKGSDYALLGLLEGASLADVKSAYRSYARKLHPDRLPRDSTPAEIEKATAQFRKVADAYERLSAQLSGSAKE
jgi:hypothetical protein